MTASTIREAKRLAKEFIKLIEEMEEAEKDQSWGSPKHRGAVKRRSMDLTRALADLRRSQYESPS